MISAPNDLPTIHQVIRTDRKTIALIVKSDGRLIVRAPRRATDEQIGHFVREKAGWIRAKQAEFIAKPQRATPKAFEVGEHFWFLGVNYPLDIVERARPALQLQERFILASSALPIAHETFTAWYREQASRVLNERVALYARHTGLTSYKRVRISSARTRWGSCSSTGTLSFPWRLVMAPLPVIDYVVVHELVHLEEKNHARRFWQRVAAIMPDYQEKIAWLRAHGHRLSL